MALRSQAGAIYGADGAAQAAITQLRRSPFNNNTSSVTHPKCFGAALTDDTLVLNNFYPGTTGGAASSAAVTCTADPNTGATGGLVPITTANKPGNAILVMGTNAGEDGLNIKALNNSTPFRVHGSVVSNSNIRVTNGSLETNVGVYARTGCSGTILSTPPPACASGPTGDPGYQFEPAFGSPAGAVPTYRQAPAAVAASCPGKVVTFQPGYYDDAQALTSLMSGAGSNPCKGSVWWFTPGVYYFDFHNSSNPLLGGSDVWTVNDGQLIAGIPTNAAGAVLAKPANPSTVPGACQNPLNSASLTVKYQNTAGATTDARTVLLTPRSATGAAGTPISVPLPSTSGSGIQTATVDLYGAGASALAAAVHSRGYSGASAAYSIQSMHPDTEKVDTVQLSLGYTAPAFRAQDTAIIGGNCLTSTYTGGSAGQCPVLSTPTAYKGSFYIQGTTYVPKTVIDLTLNNITSQVLRFGVVARSLWIKETGSITYSGPVIEVPDNSPGFGPGGTVVYLNVYLCQTAPSCTAATGKLGLRARVLIYDPTATPNPPARQITIQSWAVQR